MDSILKKETTKFTFDEINERFDEFFENTDPSEIPLDLFQSENKKDISMGEDDGSGDGKPRLGYYGENYSVKWKQKYAYGYGDCSGSGSVFGTGRGIGERDKGNGECNRNGESGGQGCLNGYGDHFGRGHDII